ncbi:MAG TPA: 5-dehydro-2-deoxygluconokinase [Woeseiaceae bacterium]|nr:5-dehydro-2-deoxygluconokinase [Woeseiaceae bacterium]
MSSRSSGVSPDVICLGRAAVDLYGQQSGGRLEDMQSFAKYLGGSSGNLAAGLARLGVRSAMLTRVGDEQMGRFVREQLAREGVDVTQVKTDPDRLTALVVLGILSADDIPHIFFREHCADMGLCADDIDEAFIASARMLAITGTHLSTTSTRNAVQKAIDAARNGGTKVVLDIDYRPVLWGLASAGEGASRFAESQEITGILQGFLPHCDFIVGTEEEIAIAGGETDTVQALITIRSLSDAVIVLKRGASGCSIFDSGPIDSLEDGIAVSGAEIDVFNTVGAGDAFLSGFLCGVLNNLSPADSGALGNACGALVVSRHGCTPAMPSRIELDTWLLRRNPPRQPQNDAELAHLHRTTTWRDDPRPLCALAFDHRSQFEQLAAQHGRPFEAIGDFKELIAEVLLEAIEESDSSVRHGAIVDHRYGSKALARLARADIWTGSPVEIPGSRPLEFEPHFATGPHLSTWPAQQVVKCLMFYHPDDDAALRHEQEQKVRALYADIVALDRRLILEVICPATEHAVTPETLPRAMRRLYNLGVRPDWWKLETQSAAGWEALSAVIRKNDPQCKGVVLLGLGADEKTLASGLTVAAAYDICRGFAVGRSIFADAARQWFAGEIDGSAAKGAIKQRYLNMIDVWCSASEAMRASA